MSKALVVLADGFEEIEALTAVDVFRRGGVETVVASLSGSSAVEGAHGINVVAETSFESVREDLFDAIVLPGGGRGTENLRRSESLKGMLEAQKERGGLVCAICAAPTLLVEWGLLEEDDHITCYPTFSVELDRKCADAPVVSDGNTITGQAPGASMLFALVVLQALEGEVIARRVARGLVTDVLD